MSALAVTSAWRSPASRRGRIDRTSSCPLGPLPGDRLRGMSGGRPTSPDRARRRQRPFGEDECRRSGRGDRPADRRRRSLPFGPCTARCSSDGRRREDEAPTRSTLNEADVSFSRPIIGLAGRGRSMPLARLRTRPARKSNKGRHTKKKVTRDGWGLSCTWRRTSATRPFDKGPSPACSPS